MKVKGVMVIVGHPVPEPGYGYGYVLVVVMATNRRVTVGYGYTPGCVRVIPLLEEVWQVLNARTVQDEPPSRIWRSLGVSISQPTCCQGQELKK